MEIRLPDFWAMSWIEFGILWASALIRCNPPAPPPMNDDETADFFAGLAASGLAVQVKPPAMEPA